MTRSAALVAIWTLACSSPPDATSPPEAAPGPRPVEPFPTQPVVWDLEAPCLPSTTAEALSQVSRDCWHALPGAAEDRRTETLDVRCVPEGAGCAPGAVGAGQLALQTVRACHRLVVPSPLWVLSSPEGLRAVLVDAPAGAVDPTVALPDGWSLGTESLPADLAIEPFGAEGTCHHLVLHDAAGQRYHTMVFPGPSWPTPPAQ